MLKRVFGNLYFLTSLNGFLLATLFYFKMEASYERELFVAIHADINNKINKTDSQDTLVVKVMHACHKLLNDRETVFAGKEFASFTSDIIEPTSSDLMTGRGACGSFSMVLARMLQAYKFPVRIAQMRSAGVFAAHNIVEVETKHGWVVLDPLFDVYFIKPSGELASFADVRNNWSFYKTHLPPNYNDGYSYEDVRYSNWTKIPLVMPAIKRMLDLTIGKEKADTISLRVYFLRKYKLFFYGTLFIFLFVLSYTVIRLIKAEVFPQNNIPVTFSNVFRYMREKYSSKEFTERGRVGLDSPAS